MTERIFHHYTAWEDWQAGLYREVAPTPKAVAEAVAVLGQAEACRAAMEGVVREWVCATEQHLTDTSGNRRAWLGRASVCYATSHPESVTRPAWFELTRAQQAEANQIADEVIAAWEDAQRHRGSYSLLAEL